MPNQPYNAFEAGEQAFKQGKKPLDNPHFSIPEQSDQFDAWSDGWITAARPKLKLYELQNLGLAGINGFPPKWRSDSLVGITASWAIDME